MLLQVAAKFESVAVWQIHVQRNQIKISCFGQLHCLFAGRCHFRFATSARQQKNYHQRNRRVALDDEKFYFFCHTGFWTFSLFHTKADFL